MTISERKNALVELASRLTEENEYLGAVIHRTSHNNPWFTKENCWKSISAIRDEFLNGDNIQKVIDHYNIENPTVRKKVGLVLAGNIPMVGMHDLLCVFLSGHKAIIKLSDKDKYLIPYCIKLLNEINSSCSNYFEVVEQLSGFDAVIATGSNNTARYFEKYFNAYPNIIRTNRTSVAVLDGNETETELLGLGEDVFAYFGLGCRSVSKIYVPKNYNFPNLLDVFHENFKKLILNSKFKHNFDYNFAILSMNKTKFMITGSLILRESDQLFSRISELFYEHYDSISELETKLVSIIPQVQTTSSNIKFKSIRTNSFGKSQQPTWFDFADGVDVFEELLLKI